MCVFRCIYLPLFRWSMIFLLSSINVNHMGWFSNVNQPCIPGMDPIVSSCIMLYIHGYPQINTLILCSWVRLTYAFPFSYCPCWYASHTVKWGVYLETNFMHLLKHPWLPPLSLPWLVTHTLWNFPPFSDFNEMQHYKTWDLNSWTAVMRWIMQPSGTVNHPCGKNIDQWELRDGRLPGS